MNERQLPENIFSREAQLVRFAVPNKDRVLNSAKMFQQIFHMTDAAVAREMTGDAQYLRRLRRRQLDIGAGEAIRMLEWMATYKKPPNSANWRPWTNEDVEHAKRARDDGKTIQQIAAMLDRSYSQVCRKFRTLRNAPNK